MVDKIRPLKLETPDNGGVEPDPWPTETDPSEDYAAVKGLALEGLDTYRVERSGNEVAFVDPTNNTKKVSDLVTATAKDAATIVAITKILNFTGDVTVTDAGSGQATINIAPIASAFTITMGFDGSASTGRYLEISGNVPSNSSGAVMCKSCTIKGLGLAIVSSSTITVSIYINNGVSPATSITLTASRKGYVSGLTIALSANDEISAKVTSGSGSKPILVIYG